MAEGTRLDNPGIRQRLSRLDELLEQVDRAPGPAAEAAAEAVRTLTEVYGEALARVLDGAAPPLVDRLTDDELVGHLLVLHDLHPEPLRERVERALAEIRPAIESHGGRVELAGIDGGVARVRLSAKGCGSSASTVEQAVTESILAMAPELTGVEQVKERAPTEPAWVPVESLVSRTGRSA
jgi:Fe-S cluster biogenesis protein NfuA